MQLSKNTFGVKPFIKGGLIISAHLLQSTSKRDIKELVDVAFQKYANYPHFLKPFFYPITPDQDKTELATFLEKISAIEPKAIVEVGTGRGGVTFLMSKIAPTAQIITIDCNINEIDQFYYHRLRKNITALNMNSQDPKTADHVAKLLEGKPIDVLFIDGDHSIAGVTRDYQNFSPQVRPGGLVVFHDINDLKLGVPFFWSSLKGNKQEIITDRQRDKYGIGVVTK